MSRRPSGSPPALSDALVDEVAGLVRTGMTPVRAARVAGVDEGTFEAWMAGGAETDRRGSRYARFREAVLRAEAECEAIVVRRVQAAAEEGDWRAAAWLAERRFPDRFLRRSVNADEQASANVGKNPFEELDNVTDISVKRRSE